MIYHYVITPIETTYINYDSPYNWNVDVYQNDLPNPHIGRRYATTLWGARWAARSIVRKYERGSKSKSYDTVGTITTRKA